MIKNSFTNRRILLTLYKIRVKLYFRPVTSVSSPKIVYFILCDGGIISCDGRRTYLPRPSHDINSGASGYDKPSVDDGAAHFDR